MHKIQSFFRHITHHSKNWTLTTPVAIIVGAVIIALGIVGYGYVSRPAGAAEPQDLVKVISKELKLKGSAWESCLASQNTTNQIGKEFNDGTSAGVNGTPTTYILVSKNGTYETASRIEGAQPENVVRQAIDRALSGNVKTTPFGGSPIAADEFVQGTKSNVVVLEYADAQCPFCVRFHPTIKNIMATYGDRIGFVYRHFPLSQIHPDALRYAAAIECAGEVKGKDAYFSFIDKLFEKEAQ